MNVKQFFLHRDQQSDVFYHVRKTRMARQCDQHQDKTLTYKTAVIIAFESIFIGKDGEI